MKVRHIHHRTRIHLLLGFLSAMHFLPSMGVERPDLSMVKRILNYAQHVDTTGCYGTTTYAYTKYTLNVSRRNAALLVVPSMYAIAHGKRRKYITETYEKVCLKGIGKYETRKVLDITTIPHRRHSMTTVLKYMTPDLYHETIIENSIFSPFHVNNIRFYKYYVTFLSNGTARVAFKPKYTNTQLVVGQAIVNAADGRVISATLSGEYDMIRFNMNLYMGEKGFRSLLPKDVRLFCNFSFMGSRTKGSFRAVYNLPEIKPEDMAGESDAERMEQIRPVALNMEETAILSTYEEDMRNSRAAQDSIKSNTPKWKERLWDMIGDNLINRIKSNYGNKNQGYLRINPILNPLYMGYDHKRGFTYKFDVRTQYLFTPNRELNLRFKSGYAFKQKQFYFTLPLYFYYNKRRNGYINMEVGNGNWTRYQRVTKKAEDIIEADAKRQQRTPGTDKDETTVREDRKAFFKDTRLKLSNNYDISDNWSFQVGLVHHKRTAVEKDFYRKAKLPAVYQSVAPTMEWQWRPTGWHGPYITLDWERGIKKFLNGDINYERWELDGQWILRPTRLHSIQMRLGTGFYTRKEGYAYFLDYSNFRENNIPGGWSDDWSCDFALLNSDEYNTSNWYARSNLTYESPILVVSRLPWLGNFVEMERIYVNGLFAKDLHPYLEAGIGFTTRLFSMGVFVNNSNGRFKEVGCKFGFELFRRW